MCPGDKKVNKKIENFKDFHRLIPEFVKEINKNQQLAIRAAVNPLLAFEELGYDLPPEVQKKVGRFIRFRTKDRKRLTELEAEIYKTAGCTFDLDSPKEVETVLFETLKMRKPKGMEEMVTLNVIEKWMTIAKKKKKKKVEKGDPLEGLKEKHAIIAPLLSYRKIQAGSSGFAPRSLYEELKAGKKKFPISKMRVRFPEQHKHEEVEDA